MHVLWVLAHPEPHSLTAELHAQGVAALREQGHTVEVSDLYAMNWNPVVDRADYAVAPDERLRVGAASLAALEADTLPADVRAEQAKLDRADALVVQFPLWWYGMPAILKGWFDRVFVRGYAYGLPDPAHPGRSLNFGHGRFAGVRALVLTSTGGTEAAFGPRGLAGDLEQVLFPLLHGSLFYTGMSVLPPLTLHSADRLDGPGTAAAVAAVRAAVTAIEHTEPLPYRDQHSGDYDEHLVLHPHVAPDRTGLDLHLDRPRPLDRPLCPDARCA